jgi:hypothetical protein
VTVPVALMEAMACGIPVIGALPPRPCYAVLRRHGCSRLKPRLPREPVRRYERERPGELLHVDVKKLGRITAPGHRGGGDRAKRAKGKAGWLAGWLAGSTSSPRSTMRAGAATCASKQSETADSTLAFAFLAACERFYGR